MDKAEQPTVTQAQYLAMRCDNMPTDCVNFGVVDTLLGKEICRVWEEEDCRMIADILNAPPIPDRTTSLAAQGQRQVMIDAMIDDPFIDDAHLTGTTQQSQRVEHYADIAIATLAPTPSLAAQDGLVEALTYLESEARRFAGMYPEASDGRNTFLIFADKIASVSAIKGDKS